MAEPPRIQSPRSQRLAVAAVMAGVFAVTMGLAYVTMAVSAAPDEEAFAEPRDVVVDGLQVTLPGQWGPDTAAARELGVERGMVLRDPQRPQRWLMVSATRRPQPTSLGEQLPRYFVALIGPEYRRLLQPLMPERFFRRDALRGVRYVGVSPAPTGPGQRLHMLAAMTEEGRRHWLVYVTDRLEPNERADAALQRNLALLERIAHSAQLEEPS